MLTSHPAILRDLAHLGGSLVVQVRDDGAFRVTIAAESGHLLARPARPEPEVTAADLGVALRELDKLAGDLFRCEVREAFRERARLDATESTGSTGDYVINVLGVPAEAFTVDDWHAAAQAYREASPLLGDRCGGVL